MRPVITLARRTVQQVHSVHLRPLARRDVGCSHWVLPPATRLYSAKPKPSKLKEEEPPIEIAEDSFGADFFEEVEVDEGEAQWEGEEVSEGVFMSAMPPTAVSAAPAADTGPAANEGPKEKRGPRTKHTIKHLNRLLSRHSVPDLDESELEERFVRGRGPGGQAINKTNSSVSLLHIPTGIRIQSQPTRSRAQNRIIARQILKERLDLMRARGQLEGIEPAAEPAPDPSTLNRKERLAAEARTWSKQELRWEKERRRKLNRKKKVNKRKNKGDAGGEEEDA